MTEVFASNSCREALLREPSSDDEALALLQPVGFADGRGALRCLRRMAGDVQQRLALADLLPHLLTALSGSANPDQVLINLERFARGAPDSALDRAALFYTLAGNPRAIEILSTLFAGSQFLTEILLRHPEYFARLAEPRNLAQSRSADQFDVAARAAVSAADSAVRQLDPLRRFQRWELLRIGTCDLLGLFDLPTATSQLSHLADSLTRVCLDMAATQSSMSVEGFAVIALGKLGGQELNYSSDIDLLFISASDPAAYRRLGERLIDALTRATDEGFLYRVDMRLRPWGQVGPLVSSLEGYLVYLRKHARLWEKQALLKARVIAGDAALGSEFLRRVEPLMFDLAGGDVRAEVHAMKRRTEEFLRGQGRTWGEVKLGEGSIRDVEFVAQYLQLRYGAEQPAVQSRNTLDALARLAARRLLSPDDQRVLADGYVFMRTVEHHLQMMHYRQTTTLPSDALALAYLARRLGFEGGDQFMTRYQQHGAAIRAVYVRHLERDGMEKPIDLSALSSAVQRHVARMDLSYAATFGEQDIQRHAALADQLDAHHLARVEVTPLGKGAPSNEGDSRVTIVGYDFPGELSLICGLLFAYGFSIYDGNVFTYEPISASPTPALRLRSGLAEGEGAARLGSAADRRKIVDVFTVRSVRDSVPADIWTHYADDLQAFLSLVRAGRAPQARGELAKRAAAILQELPGAMTPLYPVDIEIDNVVSDRYTALRIDAPDTIGFLYELTNALALSRIYIARVVVDSTGHRVHDLLYVTDADGRKIVSPGKQRELRAATVLIKHFTHLLPHSPNPESALLHFGEFMGELFSRPGWPDELASLESQSVLEALARLLGVSDFLWDDFLRMQHANLFPVVRDVGELGTAKTGPQLQAELEEALRTVHPGPQTPAQDAPWQAALNAFKDREMFRIDMRHILGYASEFWEFSEELSDLAEVVVNAVYHICHQDVRTVYGTPRLEDGQVSQMAVCGLGKCGGRELGFASDIELMFIYTGNGQTTGPQVISVAEFYERVVEAFVAAIRARREGVFRVDLQLRPYGKAGSQAVSLEAFRRYFAPGGPAWAYERQALVKLRPIAGDADLGHKVAALRDAFVYTGEPFNVTAMRAMRERQVRHLVTGGTFNAKYSPGGLVDVEYLVQGLQITHGQQQPQLRQVNTREAMAALAEANLLSEQDHARLRRAHTFLRWLIDSLRMVRGNAQDLTVPPAGSEEFAFLARRLRYGNDVARLRDELTRHTSGVQELCARVWG